MTTPSSSELSAQQQLYEDINNQLRGITDELGVQLGLQTKIKEVQAGMANTTASAMSAQMRQYVDDLRAGVRSSADFASGTSRDWDRSAGAVGSATEGMSADVKALFEKIQRSAKATAAVVHHFIPDSMRSAFRDIQMTWGGLGPNILDPANKQAARLMDINKKALQEFRLTTNAELRVLGMDVDSVFANYSEAVKDFNYIIQNRGVDALVMLETATEDTALKMGLYGEGLGLTADQMATFISRSISTTGQANLDMLDDVAKYSKGVGKAVGVSSKFIAQSIEGIIRNTERYGNITVEQAARISGSLAQMRIGYKSLDGMLAKFQGFQSSSESIGVLTSAFGVHLDALQAMKLANTDQEAFLHYMRDSIMATGKAVDDMTLPEKRLIKDVLGFSDIEEVERFLREGTVTPMEDLAAATQDMDMRSGLESIKEDIQTLDDITKLTMESMAAAVQEGLRAPWSDAAYAMEQNAIRMNRSLKTMAGGVQADAFQEFGQMVGGISAADLGKQAEGMSDLADSMTSLATASTRGDWAAVKEALGEIFDAEELGQSFKEGMVIALKGILDAFGVTFDQIEDDWNERAGPRSPSAGFGQPFVDGIHPALVETEESFVSMYGNMENAAGRSAKLISDTFGSSASQMWADMSVSRGDDEKFLGLDDTIAAVGNSITELRGISDSELDKLLTDQNSLVSNMAAMIGYELETLGDLSDDQLARYSNNLVSRTNMTVDQVKKLMEHGTTTGAAQQAELHESLSSVMGSIMGEYESFADMSTKMGEEGWKELAGMAGLGTSDEAIAELQESLSGMDWTDGGPSSDDIFKEISEQWAAKRQTTMTGLRPTEAVASAENATNSINNRSRAATESNTTAVSANTAAVKELRTALGTSGGDVVFTLDGQVVGRVAKEYIITRDNSLGDREIVIT